MEEENWKTLDGRNELVIENGGKACSVQPYISVSDTILVEEKLENEDPNYRLIISEIICNHCKDIFSVNEIYDLPEDVFHRYINICLGEDDDLKEIYDTVNEENPYKRFVLTVHESAKRQARIIADSLKPVFDSVAQRQKILVPKITLPIETMQALSNAVSEAIRPLQSSMAEVAKRLTQSVRMLPDYSSLFSGINSTLQQIVSSIRVPLLTKEDKERLLQSYEEWGKLGWTLPPDAPANIFNHPPENSRDAEKRLAPYLKQKNMEKLFTNLSELKNIKKSDLEEAVNCFKNRQYKACSMILFSMIDARLIRSQEDEERTKNGWRKAGKSAAENLFGRIDTKYITENMLFTALDQINVLRSLEAVFVDGKDFKTQPDIINRNFLDHGMLHRRVRRKDAVMLFLLLYNFTEHINGFPIRTR